METVILAAAALALYVSGMWSHYLVTRIAVDQAMDERDRWEATEYRMTDVAPASVPEPPLRLVVGGWTPETPRSDDREQMYSAERGPTPVPKPKTAPKKRATKAPRKRTA